MQPGLMSTWPREKQYNKVGVQTLDLGPEVVCSEPHCGLRQDSSIWLLGKPWNPPIHSYIKIYFKSK